MTALGHRKLRSGKEFSPFDLAVGPPVQPPQFFSVADCLRERLEAQKITQIYDEPVDISPSSLADPSVPPHPTPLASNPPDPLSEISLVPLESRDVSADLDDTTPTATSTLNRKKFGSKRRKKEKRERESAGSSDPALKSIHYERREAAKKNVLTGNYSLKMALKRHNLVPRMALSPAGLGAHSYTQEDIDRLSGTTGFSYICWLGELTIPVIDSEENVFALLGGKPKDLAGWKVVTDGAATMMSRLSPQGHFTAEDINHRRAHPDTPSPDSGSGIYQHALISGGP
ncbi:hypothetical protein MSAN_00963600 [Mycena sanguinolenta]|uniref:Uncharacterized protein n=1 Tax=Mycena sanguinolenta TaxID=230812 RepID=A0A8H7D9B2_9AGAR|nr:hypothetical protein MSAN_00963600 [Mycena sanguinolenta]